MDFTIHFSSQVIILELWKARLSLDTLGCARVSDRESRTVLVETKLFVVSCGSTFFQWIAYQVLWLKEKSRYVIS